MRDTTPTTLLDRARDLNARMTRALEQLAILDPNRDVFDAIADLLREQEQRLSMAMAIGNLGVSEWHIADDRFEVSTRWAEMLGWTVIEIGADRAAWETLVHPDDLPRLTAILGQLVRGEIAVASFEYRLRRKTGDWHRVLARALIVERRPDGRALRMLGVHADIHQQRLNERALHDAAEKLRERTEFLELAVRGSMDGLWEWRLDTDDIYLSPRFCELLGFEVGELPATRAAFLEQFCHPDELPMLRTFVEHVRNADGFHSYDCRLRVRQGTWRWFRVRGLVTRDGDGRLRRMVGSISDINERKAREAELAQTRRQLRDAIEHIDAGILMGDADDRLVLNNRRYAEIYGFSPELLEPGTLLEDLARDIYQRHPEYLDGRDLERAVAERVALHRQRIGNWELQLGDHWYRVGDFATADGGTVTLLTDITAIKLTEQALRTSEARLSTVLDHLPVAIFLNSADGHVVYANRAYLETVQLTSAEVGGETWQAHVHPDDRERVLKSWREYCLAPQGVFAMEYRGHGVEGRDRLLYGRGVPVYEGDQILGFVGTIEDITARRDDEIERQRLHNRIQQAQKMEAVGQLTGGIAHDFNNILAGILGFASLAGSIAAPYGDARLDEYLAAVRQAGERARELIAKMLEFSRDAPIPHNTSVAPLMLLTETVRFLQPIMPAGIRIVTDFDPQVGDVRIDGVDLHQALVNLALNARDAIGEHGEITLTLERRRRRRGQCASCKVEFDAPFTAITVADTGPGVPPEHLQHLFEPFFSTKDVGKGTGMGLAVTHGVIHRAGGHIMVETSMGIGTKVRLMLREAN